MVIKRRINPLDSLQALANNRLIESPRIPILSIYHRRLNRLCLNNYNRYIGSNMRNKLLIKGASYGTNYTPCTVIYSHILETVYISSHIGYFATIHFNDKHLCGIVQYLWGN